jgi:hypothetical protein
MQRNILAFLFSVLCCIVAGCGKDDTLHAAKAAARLRSGLPPSIATPNEQWRAASYAGTDARGVPHYFNGQVNPDARRILRDAFGIVTPSHLYISDSSKDGVLKYDPAIKPCAICYVNSYRIGFVSIRRKAESWDDLEHRIRTLTRGSFPAGSLVTSNSVSTMDPDVQAEVQQMLDAARRAGFVLHIVSTYRSPEQEALLMSAGGGRTHTLTSMHSYGRAIDVCVGDGHLYNPATRRNWIAFRSWVTRYRGDDFRVIGTPDRSWDWPHVELPSDRIGFRSVDAAVAAGRACLSKPSPAACDFQPNLPGSALSGTRE